MRYAAKVKTVKKMNRKFYRIVIANFNAIQFDNNLSDPLQSFAPRYIIAESGDFTQFPTEEQAWKALAEMVKNHWLKPTDELIWF